MHSNEQELNFLSLQEKIIFPEKALVNRQHNSKSNCFFFFKDLSKSWTKKWRLDKTLMTGIQENKQICLKMKILNLSKRMGDLTGSFFPVIKNGVILFGTEAEKSFLEIVLSCAQDR